MPWKTSSYALLVGLLLVGGSLLLGARTAIAGITRPSSEPSSLDGDYTIEITSGPTGLTDHPFPDGEAAGYGWELSVTPAVGTATITSVRSDEGTTLASSCYTGGLNGGVGTVHLKRSCLGGSVSSYTVCFQIGLDVACIEVVNPVANGVVIVPFDPGDLQGVSSGTFVVRAVDDSGEVLKNYTGPVWVTAFSLTGSRVRLEGTASGRARVDLVHGEGDVDIEVVSRVPGDTLILEIVAPRLDTARSSVRL